MHAQNARHTRTGPRYPGRRMARPKRNPDRIKVVGVRMSEVELELLQRAVAKELQGVTGATPSLPKFMLAASLDRARRITGEK